MNAQDNENKTPLYCATNSRYYFTNSEHIVSLLIENHADVNDENVNKKVPLHCAAIREHSIILVSFLKYGADPDAADHFGKTPLNFAKDKNYKVVISMLEQAVTQKR